MDLNPREAVVDQESSHTSEQEEEPTQALPVPEDFVKAVIDCLDQLADDRRGPKLGRGGDQAVHHTMVRCTRYAATDRGHDYHCGDHS
jgi:hypothetical protein